MGKLHRVSIIGANSYIARNMVLEMKRRGDFCLFLYDQQENQTDGWSEYRQIDILSEDSLESVEFECESIYVFAGITGTANGFDEYTKYITINEIGLLNILNMYRKKKSKAKIIFPSTRLVYKGVRGRLKEDAEKEFKTMYAMTKYACENYLEMYRNAYQIPYCILRICLPYGTMLPDSASYGTAEFFAARGRANEDICIYGDGEQRRTLTHIQDLTEILIQAGLNGRCVNDIYNVGGSDELSIREIAETIADIYHVGVNNVEWPEMAYKLESGDTVFDSEKLDHILGYEYKRRFRDWALGQAEGVRP